MKRDVQEVRVLGPQKKSYDQTVEAALQAKIPLFDPTDGRTHLTMLSMYASAVAYQDPDTHQVVLTHPSNKTLALSHFLKAWDTDKRLVIITVSEQMAQLARSTARSKAGKPKVAAPLTDRTLLLRQRAIDDHNKGTRPILVITTQALGIGDFLPQTKRALFLQRSWSDVENEWVESLLPDDCHITTFVTTNTLDVHQHWGWDHLSSKLDPGGMPNFLFGRNLEKVIDQ